MKRISVKFFTILLIALMFFVFKLAAKIFLRYPTTKRCFSKAKFAPCSVLYADKGTNIKNMIEIRYECACGKTFLPTTGTIFDDHKISVSEWMEYCLNLFRHVSITADSWSNKNTFKTSRYWLQKLS